MTKRRDIIKAIRNAADERDLAVEITEGGNHTIIELDGMKIPVPRHNEVRELTARSIYKQAAAKLGEDWWK
ncbi:hypothetical protein [Nocardia miyunensis]|uniref:hypothetical protein n=1 Tax=Nocardia miyunensis TaxID=282684 RepID=UPI000831F7DA|nr:hypothetical protein [Nocardia miyunensis]